MQDVLHQVLADRLAQPRPEAHIAPGAEHRVQKIALLAQVVEELHEKRQRPAGRAEGQHIRQGDGLHASLQGIEVGHDLVLQHGEQPVLVAEVVVEGAARRIGPLAQIVHGERIVAALLHELDEGAAQGPPRFRDAPILAGGGRRAGCRGYDGLLRSVAMQRSYFDRTAKNGHSVQ